jgi:hypothetical protein
VSYLKTAECFSEEQKSNAFLVLPSASQTMENVARSRRYGSKVSARHPRRRFRRKFAGSDEIPLSQILAVTVGVDASQETFKPRGPRAQPARREPSGCASAVRLAREEEPECGVTEFAEEQRYGKGGRVG